MTKRRSGVVPVELGRRVFEVLGEAAKATPHHEAGGLLLGWWVDEAISVYTAVPVSDPGATAASWTRYEDAAQHALDDARIAHGIPELGYVGDWHTHPAQIGMSPADATALQRVSHQYQLPIALIIRLPDGTLDVHIAQSGRIRPTTVKTRDEERPCRSPLTPQSSEATTTTTCTPGPGPARH